MNQTLLLNFGANMCWHHVTKASLLPIIFLDIAACSSLPCKEGKDLSDKCNTVFTCRHLDLVKGGPACQPQSPILCEDIR